MGHSDGCVMTPVCVMVLRASYCSSPQCQSRGEQMPAQARDVGVMRRPFAQWDCKVRLSAANGQPHLESPLCLLTEAPLLLDVMLFS